MIVRIYHKSFRMLLTVSKNPRLLYHQNKQVNFRYIENFDKRELFRHFYH